MQDDRDAAPPVPSRALLLMRELATEVLDDESEKATLQRQLAEARATMAVKERELEEARRDVCAMTGKYLKACSELDVVRSELENFRWKVASDNVKLNLEQYLSWTAGQPS